MFGLTEEQEQLRKEVRAFAEREVAPHVSDHARLLRSEGRSEGEIT